MSKDTTIKDVVTWWLTEHSFQLKDSSISRYRYLINVHILPCIGSVKLSEVSTAFLCKFSADKLRCGRVDGSGGLSSSYVRSIMLILDASINYAMQKQLCSPFQYKVHKPVIMRKNIQILSAEEQIILEDYLCTETNVTKIGILITLYTGLRIGEICALTWDDIDMQSRIIYVRHTVVRNIYKDGNKNRYVYELDSPKTNSSIRCIPICSKLYDILCSQKCGSFSGYVLSSSNAFINPRTYEYRYKRTMLACSVPCVNYHALRHTFATRCIEAGVDIKSLSEILGHANTSITLNTYIHSSMMMKRQQLEKLVQLSHPSHKNLPISSGN